MKLKRIKSIKINCFTFRVKWTNKHGWGSFFYLNEGGFIEIGTKGRSDNEIFMIVCHELMEICAVEMSVRLNRPDCTTDYLFVYDHRQYETMINMFSGLLSEFIK
jgi:hypothetical protein